MDMDIAVWDGRFIFIQEGAPLLNYRHMPFMNHLTVAFYSQFNSNVNIISAYFNLWSRYWCTF